MLIIYTLYNFFQSNYKGIYSLINTNIINILQIESQLYLINSINSNNSKSIITNNNDNKNRKDEINFPMTVALVHNISKKSLCA